MSKDSPVTDTVASRQKPERTDGTTTRRRGRSGTGAPTIYDIAKLAGVNPSTVSRALSQPGRLNIKTEQRVHAAAKELNYQLNPIARALPTGRTSTLALLVADITNPVLFGIVRGAEQAASAASFTLVIAESQESGDLEATAAQRVLPSVDGLVLATTRLSDEQITELASRKPVVVMNRRVEGVASVVPDLAPGVDETVRHLHDLGHRSLVYLSGPATSWMSRERWTALTTSVRAHGMSLIEIGPNLPTLDAGAATLERVRLSGATAVVAFNDLMAIGLLREATRNGVRVPQDLSIVGFDDIFGSDFTSPALSTIRSPLRDAGERAVDLLLARIASGPAGAADPARDVLRTELVVRGSTGSPAPA